MLSDPRGNALQTVLSAPVKGECVELEKVYTNLICVFVIKNKLNTISDSISEN